MSENPEGNIEKEKKPKVERGDNKPLVFIYFVAS